MTENMYSVRAKWTWPKDEDESKTDPKRSSTSTLSGNYIACRRTASFHERWAEREGLLDFEVTVTNVASGEIEYHYWEK